MLKHPAEVIVFPKHTFFLFKQMIFFKTNLFYAFSYFNLFRMYFKYIAIILIHYILNIYILLFKKNSVRHYLVVSLESSTRNIFDNKYSLY